MATSALPGWYADSGRPGMLRYWDGTTWTEREAPGSVTGRVPTITPGLVSVRITAGVLAALAVFGSVLSIATGN